MRKHFLVAVAALITLSVAAQFKSEPFMTKTFKSGSFTSTDVQTSGGNIAVTGIDGAESKVEVYITGNNGKDNLSKEEIQQRLDELYNLEVAVKGNKLVANAKPKERIRDWKKGLSIGFKLYVPKSTANDLTTSGGNIVMSDLTGTQDFTTSGGNIDIDMLSGKVKGRTSGGNISLKNSKNEIDLVTSGGNIEAANSEGHMRLSTSGGSVYLKDLKGDIKATTSGGNMQGKNIGGELFAETSGGNVHLKDLACSLETATSGGNINVSVREFGKYVTIRNSGGNIDLELPKGKGADLNLEGDKIRTSSLESFSGTLKDDEVEGKLNGGGVPVKVRAGSGHISLALK